MAVDRGARLERMLARHQDAVTGETYSGDTAVYRRDQILVSLHQADRAHLAADRWITHREDFPELGVTRLHLRPEAEVHVGELAAALREQSDGPITAAANHLLRGEPSYAGGPSDLPVPTRALPRPVAAGQDERRVVVAVLDTGIVAHPWFEGTDWFAEVTADQVEPLPPELDFELETQTGHGTLVAGVILRQCPNAFLMVERTLGDDGVCDELSLLRDLARVHARLRASGDRLDVLNLSFGGYTIDDQPNPLVSDAIAKFGKRTAVVAAAGNHGSNRPFWPAAFRLCVAVGALDEGGERRSDFSNYGWWVDAGAVGVGVTGPFISGVTSSGTTFEGFAQWSGTSFAAAAVSGALAATAARSGQSVYEAADLLLDPATRPRIPDLGVLVGGGTGDRPERPIDSAGDANVSAGVLIDPARTGRRPEVWIVGDEVVRQGSVVTVGFGFFARSLTSELPSWWSEEPPLPAPVRLRVLLKARGALVQPPARRCLLRTDRTTDPVFFAVTARDAELVSLTFSVYLERDGQLLQEVETELAVEPPAGAGRGGGAVS